MKSETAIRPKDKFKCIASGEVWEVCQDLAFGRLEVICRTSKGRILQGLMYKRELRNTTLYERVSK
jgi:hypothetical protein